MPSLSVKPGMPSAAISLRSFLNVKVLILIGLLSLAVTSAEVARVIARSFADAYLQVTVFVAATLFLFYFIEHHFKWDVAFFFRRYRQWQVPTAAFLGMLPGCGGAIIVITKYLQGGLSFGSVVAVLTATMGDAAFVLLAQSPTEAFIIFSATLIVGVVSGKTVDLVHGSEFLRPRNLTANRTIRSAVRRVDSKVSKTIWVALLIPGVFVGIAVALQFNTDIFGAVFGIDTLLWLGIFGSLISLVIWTISPLTEKSGVDLKETEKDTTSASLNTEESLNNVLGRVVGDTVFVTAWVIVAFLIYELGVYYFQFELGSLFHLGAIFVPLIAIIVGFIPGCGPQVLVCSMYLNGVLPFSAEVGNAISNDGDALFPAIALDPKIAVIATLYSAIPAILVAYSYYWLFE